MTATDPPELLIVGVGASAGGLEALYELVAKVRLDHMAFVVVQHLSPNHESLLTQLLARASSVQVVTITDGMKVEGGKVYVLPPNFDLVLRQGVLHLVPLGSRVGPHLPIDAFFRSLAEDQGSRALGVVLSGTGTDGTFGLKAIKEAGGVTLVQDPTTARYEGMPQSALRAGLADYQLSPREIAEELEWLASAPRAPHPDPPALTLEASEQYARLFALVRGAFGNDLTLYKSTTVQRRVERRMSLQRISRLDEYVRFVQGNAEELRTLNQDTLISVTQFFRDRDPFEALGAQILPALLGNKPAGATVRVWVPACATGEEIYSLVICFLEFIEAHRLDFKLQFFGSDVDDIAIDIGRRALYPRNIALDVSPDRLARFFIDTGDQYQVARRVRDLVIFSRHNIYRDPPFSRIDLISCRNLLIYLQPATQKRVLRVLHHALVPGGQLMLGTSETVGDLPELFGLVDRKNKIYAKKAVAGLGPLDVGYLGRAPDLPPRPGPVRSVSLQTLAERKLLESYSPPGVIVDEKLRVVHFHGHTGPFLEPATGNPSFDLTRVVRPELRVEVKRLFEQAVTTRARASADVEWSEGDARSVTRVEVAPLADHEAGGRCYLVAFVALPRPVRLPMTPSSPEADQRVAELNRELTVSRDALQALQVERSVAEEEFKFTNEELQSTNEELQSTNEELETSKEELQSTNEELVTINDELQNRMKELRQINDDLHNVLLGVDQPVVIAGLDFRIRRFTLAAERLFDLMPSDVGRTLDVLERFVGPCNLNEKVSRVVHTLVTLEEEVHASNRRWYRMRVTPYKTTDHAIRGAVITFADIDVRKKATDRDHEVTDYAARFLAAVTQPLALVDRRLRVVWANDRFFSRLQVTREEIMGSQLGDLGTRQWLDAALHEKLVETLDKGSIVRDVAVAGLLRDDAGRALKLGASRVPISADAPLALVLGES